MELQPLDSPVEQQRAITVKVPVPRRLRLKRWIRGVWDAICTRPPETDTQFRTLNPGDPGYEDAPFIVQHQPIKMELIPEHMYWDIEYDDTNQCNEGQVGR